MRLHLTSTRQISTIIQAGISLTAELLYVKLAKLKNSSCSSITTQVKI